MCKVFYCQEGFVAHLAARTTQIPSGDNTWLLHEDGIINIVVDNRTYRLKNMGNKETNTKNNYVISHMKLRRLIGLTGMLLPLILVIGDILLFEKKLIIQPSISDYYFTGMRDVLIGFLIALALFFYSYKYKEDNVIANIAGLSVALDALFPTGHSNVVVQTIHFVSAGIFIVFLGYFSYFVFTKYDKNIGKTPMKIIRNKIYRICGIIIFASFSLLVIYFIINGITGLNLEEYRYVFWVETVILEAFGFSWLVKGGVFFKDEQPIKNPEQIH